MKFALPLLSGLILVNLCLGADPPQLRVFRVPVTFETEVHEKFGKKWSELYVGALREKLGSDAIQISDKPTFKENLHIFPGDKEARPYYILEVPEYLVYEYILKQKEAAKKDKTVSAPSSVDEFFNEEAMEAGRKIEFLLPSHFRDLDPEKNPDLLKKAKAAPGIPRPSFRRPKRRTEPGFEESLDTPH